MLCPLTIEWIYLYDKIQLACGLSLFIDSWCKYSNFIVYLRCTKNLNKYFVTNGCKFFFPWLQKKKKRKMWFGCFLKILHYCRAHFTDWCVFCLFKHILCWGELLNAPFIGPTNWCDALSSLLSSCVWIRRRDLPQRFSRLASLAAMVKSTPQQTSLCVMYTPCWAVVQIKRAGEKNKKTKKRRREVCPSTRHNSFAFLRSLTQSSSK